MRISAFISKKYNISRREAKEAIKCGNVKVNDKICVKDIEVTNDSQIEININKVSPIFDINDYILSKKGSVIFLYKPPFMHSERRRSDDELTLDDLVNNFNNYKGITRLDYEADGVVAIVRNDYKVNLIRKKYYAIVEGFFPDSLTASWEIDADNKKKVKVIDTSDKGNITIMKRIDGNDDFSLIEVTLEKAARHQVRAFCAHTKHPILGDKIYNGKTFRRLCLHCFEYRINELSQTSEQYKENFIQIYENIKYNKDRIQ